MGCAEFSGGKVQSSVLQSYGLARFGLPRCGIRVEPIRVLPAELLADSDLHSDVGFGSNHGPHRPYSHINQRVIATNHDTSTRLMVLNRDLVILCGVSESFE